MPFSMMAFRRCVFRDVTGEVTSQALSLPARPELSLAILSLLPLNYMLFSITGEVEKSVTVSTLILTQLT
jgi:hypothetical protein